MKHDGHALVWVLFITVMLSGLLAGDFQQSILDYKLSHQQRQQLVIQQHLRSCFQKIYTEIMKQKSYPALSVTMPLLATTSWWQDHGNYCDQHSQYAVQLILAEDDTRYYRVTIFSEGVIEQFTVYHSKQQTKLLSWCIM